MCLEDLDVTQTVEKRGPPIEVPDQEVEGRHVQLVVLVEHQVEQDADVDFSGTRLKTLDLCDRIKELGRRQFESIGLNLIVAAVLDPTIDRIHYTRLIPLDLIKRHDIPLLQLWNYVVLCDSESDLLCQ